MIVPPKDGLSCEGVNVDGLAQRLVAMERALAVQSEACRHFAAQLTQLAMLSHPGVAAKGTNTTPRHVGGVCSANRGSSAPMPESQRCLTTRPIQSKEQLHVQRHTEHDQLLRRRYKRRQKRLKRQQLQESLFPDAQKVIERVTWNITESSNDVTCYYKTNGIFQSIARNDAFEKVTLLVIIANMLWIAYDVDANPPHRDLHSAPLLFKVVTSIFCIFFVGELFVRFMAFRHKQNWIRDPWCVFDSIVVSLMVVELYLQTSVVHGLRLLRGLRLIRLLKLLRMGRIFKYAPEMMTVVRGISLALRAIMVICMLLIVIIYFCGVGFRILLEDTELGNEKFNTVLAAMGTLLLDCTLSGTKGVPLIKAAYEEDFFYAVFLLIFVLISAVTVMGVLSGLLVQTVKTVADVEKEERTIRCMVDKIEEVWNYISQRDAASGMYVSAKELHHLSEDQELAKTLRGMDIDPQSLRSVSNFVLEEHGLRMRLPEFKRVLLDLRGKNVAKVRDHVETRKFIRSQIQQAIALPTTGCSLGVSATATANTSHNALQWAEQSSSDSDSDTEPDM